MVPQFRVRFSVALAILTPLLRVSVVLPLIITGAAGLAIAMSFHVTAAPREFVQFAAVDTVAFQMALSLVPGAVPLTQLPPDCKAVLLLALVWSACASVAVSVIRATRKAGRLKEQINGRSGALCIMEFTI